MFKKKVCKGCGRSGVFLQLNEELLCPECIELESKRMSMKEVTDELGEYLKGTGTTKKIEDYIKAQESKEIREKRNFYRKHNSYVRARELEKQGQTDKALEIYLNLLEECPAGTDYYVRPCIILEKKKEYEKALEVCDMAIVCIRQGRFHADENEFIKRRERLEKKVKTEI